jgi:hypothetical protein
MFQMIKQAKGKEAWASLSGINVLHTGETVWKMMRMLFGQEQSDLNS